MDVPGYYVGMSRYHEARHTITLRGGKIERDGKPVKVTRISDSMIRIGCTKVEIDVLRRLIYLANESERVLQDGAE
jgi:hypothetical protein